MSQLRIVSFFALTDSATPDSILSYAARSSLSSPSTNQHPGNAYHSPSSSHESHRGIPSHPDALSSAYSPYSSSMVANYYYDQIIKSERLSPHSHSGSGQTHIVLASHESPLHGQEGDRPSVVSIISWEWLMMMVESRFLVVRTISWT